MKPAFKEKKKKSNKGGVCSVALNHTALLFGYEL